MNELRWKFELQEVDNGWILYVQDNTSQAPGFHTKSKMVFNHLKYALQYMEQVVETGNA